MTEDIPGSPSKDAERSRPDLVTLAGLFVALAGIFGGLLMEGGRIKDVAQLTAALIVLGGTAGAVMVSAPLSTRRNAVCRLKDVILDSAPDLNGAIDEVIAFATQARKQGLVSLEPAANRLEDLFLRKALNLAVDGAKKSPFWWMLSRPARMDRHPLVGHRDSAGSAEALNHARGRNHCTL